VNRYIEGEVLGKGIKTTPAYETAMQETEFNSARELFWSISRKHIKN